MSKLVIEVDESDTPALRKVIKCLQEQIKINRDKYSEKLQEDRIKELAPGSDLFLPDVKIRSVLNTSFRSVYSMEKAGIDTLGDLIKMSRYDLIQLQSVGHTVVNEIDSFLWTVYGKRLTKISNNTSKMKDV